LKTVELQILGQKLKISSDNGEEHARKLGDFVNAKLEELRGRSKNVPVQNLLMLGMLNLAEDNFRIREEWSAKSAETAGRIKRMIEMIDESA